MHFYVLEEGTPSLPTFRLSTPSLTACSTLLSSRPTVKNENCKTFLMSLVYEHHSHELY